MSNDDFWIGYFRRVRILFVVLAALSCVIGAVTHDATKWWATLLCVVGVVLASLGLGVENVIKKKREKAKSDE